MRISRDRQKGQAFLLVVVASSIFIFGALGLAIDGAQMYAQLQMAQVAADAGAQAGVMTIFDGTDSTLTASSLPITCSSSDTRSPCVYVQKNGFLTSADTVTVDNPGTLAGVKVSTGTVPLRVTVRRTISTTFMKFLGPTSSTIQARGVAAIVDIYSPVPILVTHPTMAGALSANGGPTIKICGGPGRSIQVNSNNLSTGSSGGAVNMPSNTTVDLSHAGPLDPGNCTSGTGADFGTFGLPSSPTFNFLAGVGQYDQPASPVPDPLAAVNPPSKTGLTVDPPTAPLANGVSGCPVLATKPCVLYSPGVYSTTNIDVKNQTAVFKPGIYYIESNQGFQNSANGDAYMATGFAPDAATGPGMLIYDTNTALDSNNNAKTGGFSIGANGTANLAGSGCSAVTKLCDATNYYQGVLAFEDRNAIAHVSSKSHNFGGGGAMALIGTIYITNTKTAMLAAPLVYQTVQLKGSSGNATVIQGEIIAGALSIGGNAGITMNLSSQPNYIVRQVALVK